MPNNFKTCHNSGIIRLVYQGEVKKVYKYSGIEQRKKIMEKWERQMNDKKYYIELIPDWYLWNGKLN